MAVQRTIAIDIAGSIWRGYGLTAENTGDPDLLALPRCAVVFAQLIAHLGQQWVMGGQCEIIHIHLVRMPLAPCCTHGDVQHPMGLRPYGQCSFGFDLVTGINESVYGRLQQGRPVSRLHKLLHAMNDAVRVDLCDAITPVSYTHLTLPTNREV